MADEVENVFITEQSVEDQDTKLFGGEELDDVKPPEKKEIPPVEDLKKKEEPEPDEEDDDEEIKEEETEDLEPIEGFKQPTFSQINEKFPEFFKTFPEMREVMGREHAFAELFPEGIDQAKSVKDNDKDFTFFSEKVIEGDAKSFLEVIKDTGKADLGKFVSNFLPSLREVDSNLYMETTAPVLVDILQLAYNAGDGAGNENLKNAALHLSKYIFNNEKFATGEVKLKSKEEIKEPEKKDDEISKERQEFFVERYKDAFNTVSDKLETRLKDSITPELPDDFNDFLKETVTERIIKEADNLLRDDPQHQKNMTRLWELAARSKFDINSRTKIVNTVWQRYNEVIPEIRRKNIARAKGTKVRDEPRKELVSGSRSAGKTPTRSSKQIDYSKTSDEQLFAGDKTYK